jgi:hypothetical protein
MSFFNDFLYPLLVAFAAIYIVTEIVPIYIVPWISVSGMCNCRLPKPNPKYSKLLREKSARLIKNTNQPYSL